MFGFYRVQPTGPVYFPRLRPTPYPSRTERLVLPRPPRPVPPLPNEIIEFIVNALYLLEIESEVGLVAAQATMAMLCRVAKGFLGPARAALYHRQDITIQGGEYSNSEDIYDYFSDTPDHTRLVRDVTVRIEPPLRNVEAAHHHVFEILEICPRVSHLGLILEETRVEDARRTVVRLAERCPPLRSLEIEAPLSMTEGFLDDLGSLLVSQPGLKHLDLILIQRRGTVPLAARGIQPTFELLTLHLHLPQNDLDPSLFLHLTSSSIKSLTSLTLGLPFTPNLTDTQFDWGIFPNLTTLCWSGKLQSPNLAATLETLLIPPLKSLDISRMRFEEPGGPVWPFPNLFSYLAPTLTVIVLPEVSLSNLIAFIISDQCPGLLKLEGKLDEGNNHWAFVDMLQACPASTRNAKYRCDMWNDQPWSEEYRSFMEERPPVVPFVGPSRLAAPLFQAVLERFW